MTGIYYDTKQTDNISVDILQEGKARISGYDNGLLDYKSPSTMIQSKEIMSWLIFYNGERQGYLVTVNHISLFPL